MERGSFLKSLILGIVAPTLLGEVPILPTDTPNDNFGNIQEGRIRIYLDDIGSVRVGDIIRSDYGDTALVLTIFNSATQKYIEAKSIIPNTYRYKDKNKVQIFANATQERSLHQSINVNNG
jgi:hypothetical protein